MAHLTQRRALQNLADTLVQDILEASDEEILAEAIEDYGSEEEAAKVADAVRKTIVGVLRKEAAKASTSSESDA